MMQRLTFDCFSTCGLLIGDFEQYEVIRFSPISRVTEAFEGKKLPAS